VQHDDSPTLTPFIGAFAESPRRHMHIPECHNAPATSAVPDAPDQRFDHRQRSTGHWTTHPEE
jgi:hypothetical protein